MWFRDWKIGHTLVGTHEEVDGVKVTVQEPLLRLVDLDQSIRTL